MNSIVEKIRQVKEKNIDSIFKKANVVGVGIGKRIKGGQLTEELCLKVYVEKKIAKSQLDSNNIIQEEIGGVKTDVVGVGRIRFFQCNQKTRKRPAFGGDSCGSCHSLRYGYIMAGTLGCTVVDKTDGKRCILSNNHVLADMDSDTESRANAGDPIVQPGTYDGGSCATDRIATLKRWVPLHTSSDNLVDAAIGEIITDSDVSNEIGCNIGGVNGIRELTVADINTLQVQKCGEATCYTTGTVIDIDASVNVKYEVLTNTGIVIRIYRFIHQILTTSMSTLGDSGSLIMDMDKKAVGLLFAGSNVITVANPIQTVLDELNIEFPVPEVLCIVGGPFPCAIGGPFIPCAIGGPIHCVIGGPGNPPCTIGGPIHCVIGPNISCVIGGPNIHCAIGGPDRQIDFCTIGGPLIGKIECGTGGPYLIRCLACGPDSPIACGSGGPDFLIDTIHCAAGPGIDFRFKIPIEDPRRLVILDTARIPKSMQKAFTDMLKAMAKER